MKRLIRKILTFFKRRNKDSNKENRMDDNLFENVPDAVFKDLRFPEARRNFYDMEDVVLYSYYLKQLGITQSLHYGDWYATKDPETDQVISKVYEKTSIDDTSDFDFLTEAKFIRLISQEEALNILNQIGFFYNDYAPSILGYTDEGKVFLNITNEIYGISFRIEASNTHSAHLKALHTAWSYLKTTQNCNISLHKKGFFNDKE